MKRGMEAFVNKNLTVAFALAMLGRQRVRRFAAGAVLEIHS